MTADQPFLHSLAFIKLCLWFAFYWSRVNHGPPAVTCKARLNSPQPLNRWFPDERPCVFTQNQSPPSHRTDETEIWPFPSDTTQFSFPSEPQSPWAALRCAFTLSCRSRSKLNYMRSPAVNHTSPRQPALAASPRQHQCGPIPSADERRARKSTVSLHFLYACETDVSVGREDLSRRGSASHFMNESNKWIRRASRLYTVSMPGCVCTKSAAKERLIAISLYASPAGIFIFIFFIYQPFTCLTVVRLLTHTVVYSLYSLLRPSSTQRVRMTGEPWKTWEAHA